MADPGTGHVPVLPAAVMEYLSPQPGEVVLDATVGLGGHARMLAEAIGAEGVLIGLDVDPDNLAVADEALKGASCRVALARCNFAEFDSALESAGVDAVDILLADLGLSSRQLDDPMRGFSFQQDGPLDMRMDPDLSGKAVDLVNALKEEQLSDLIYFNAQERFSRRIAKRICQARREGRITTTARLAEVVCKAVGASADSRKSRIHPATRVFQALRIAVNDELGSLAALLEKAPDHLAPGGRIGVIAFHSLEDGPVKRDFRKRKTEGVYEILTKRPIVADPEERQANPRSRSAKLRVARRRAQEDVARE